METKQKRFDVVSEHIAVVLFFTTLIVILFMLLHSFTGLEINNHACYDSYTRQAMAWRDGNIHLPDGENLTWLELAIYDGKYYVSFPPVPSLIMLPLTFRYGMETPNALMCWLYGYLSFFVAYLIFVRRCGRKPWIAGFYAFCYFVGCNAFFLTFGGWVWYQAQILGFLLATTAVYFIMGNKKIEHCMAYLFWALAVVCRPFHALFAPYLLYNTFKTIYKNDTRPFKIMIAEFTLMILPAVVIGISMMVYNYVRFDNIFEFGHNYLPGHTRLAEGQFSLTYVGENYMKLFRLPWIEDGILQFYYIEGNNFFITNPIYIILIIAMIKYRKNPQAWMIFSLVLLNAFLFLTHKCMGALQFGMRFFVDMIPWILALLLIDRDFKERLYVSIIGVFGVAINIYGAWWFWIYKQLQ